MKWFHGLMVGVLGLGLAACGSGSGSSKPGAQAQAGGVNGGQSATATATMIGLAHNPAQGSILVDSTGRTLYLFEHDNGTKSACTGACASVWPALTAGSEPSAGSGVDGSLLGTADGQVANQVTYHGHLLYLFSGDSGPGDVKGVGIPGWYPVSPSGDKVDKEDATTSSSSSGYGY
jgi:predicted lipoprotein with Yx(FWY)xxD motif